MTSFNDINRLGIYSNFYCGMKKTSITLYREGYAGEPYGYVAIELTHDQVEVRQKFKDYDMSEKEAEALRLAILIGEAYLEGKND